jgi:hypothetical protein
MAVRSRLRDIRFRRRNSNLRKRAGKRVKLTRGAQVHADSGERRSQNGSNPNSSLLILEQPLHIRVTSFFLRRGLR